MNLFAKFQRMFAKKNVSFTALEVWVSGASRLVWGKPTPDPSLKGRG